MNKPYSTDLEDTSGEFYDDYPYYGNDYGKSVDQIAYDNGIDLEDYWRDRE